MALPKITLSRGASAIEGSTNGTYQITLDIPAPAGGLAINFNTTGSTATFDIDYKLTAGDNLTLITANSFTIAAGAKTATLNLIPLADNVIDPKETVSVNLIASKDYNIVKFTPKTDIQVTANDTPYAISVADFNNDGNTDFAVTNINDNTISVYERNTTNTGFDAKSHFTTGEFPISVSSGDFNNDGKTDLAVANYFSNTVSIFSRNTDNTSFEAKTDIATDNFPYAVSAGDFNGDGKLDLVTANKNSNTISVLLRNADNTGFETKEDIPTGSSPKAIGVGDFNGDGQTDLAIVNADSNSVSILLRNISNTGFETKQDISIGADPWSIAVADFNNDSKTDFAVTNFGNDTVSVLLRNATNTGFDAEGDYETGAAPNSIAVADFNNDGKTDLAVVNADDNSISLLQNVSSSHATVSIAQPANHPVTGTVTINDTTPKLDQVLKASNTLADVDGLGTVTYSWLANKTVIGTGNSYTVTANEVGKTINVVATYTDKLGYIERVDSANTDIVYLLLNGTTANDLLNGNLGHDVLNGSAGNDTLNGNEGNDTLNGGTGDDILNGNTGNDVLNGSYGNDVLNGGNHNDTLNGGDGNDTLIGGTGDDLLVGGVGVDTFKAIGIPVASERDTISDFQTGIDKIDLSAIDASSSKTGNNAFTSLIVGDAFVGTFVSQGELYFDNSSHVLYGNNDSDATADFSILLQGITTLSTMDFVL